MYDLEVIHGRPASMRLTFYTTADEDFLLHRGEECMINHVGNLRKMVAVCDSVKKYSVKMTEIQ